MADTYQYHHHQLVLHQHRLSQQQQQHQQQQEAPPQPPPQRSRLGRGLRTTPGEIVEVQGGHIVRSTGRKDRHSKVCTAKGPRDRRVRLSAHTAIQFYDVQDRLGYDRPSKAVDWLIKNAKAAIDELAELPAWHPTSSSSVPPPPPPLQEPVANVDSSKKPVATAAGSEPAGASSHYGYGGSSSFLPPSLESDSIVDTIKSFFPTVAGASSTVPSPTQPQLGYQNYPPSRTSSHSQNLRLSLHSLQQDPIYHHAQSGHHAPFSSDPHNVAYAAAAASMPQWNVADAASGGGGGSSDGGGGGGGEGGFMFSVPPPPQAVPLHSMMLGQGQFFTQRGPLQSSYPPFARPWVDPIPASASQQQQQHSMHMLHPSSVFQSISFAPSGSSSSGFSGFRIPARIQGGEEEHDGTSDKPSSASSGSHH